MRSSFKGGYRQVIIASSGGDRVTFAIGAELLKVVFRAVVSRRAHIHAFVFHGLVVVVLQ